MKSFKIQRWSIEYQRNKKVKKNGRKNVKYYIQQILSLSNRIY